MMDSPGSRDIIPAASHAVQHAANKTVDQSVMQGYLHGNNQYQSQMGLLGKFSDASFSSPQTWAAPSVSPPAEIASSKSGVQTTSLGYAPWNASLTAGGPNNFQIPSAAPRTLAQELNASVHALKTPQNPGPTGYHQILPQPLAPRPSQSRSTSAKPESPGTMATLNVSSTVSWNPSASTTPVQPQYSATLNSTPVYKDLMAAHMPLDQSLAIYSNNGNNPSPSLAQLPPMPSGVSPAGQSHFLVVGPDALKKSVSGIRQFRGHAAIGGMDTTFSQLKAFPASSIPYHDHRYSTKDLRHLSLGDEDIKNKLASKKLTAKTGSRTLGSTASPASISLSDSDSETERDSSDDENDEESPLPARRPNDPSGAVEYDVIQAVWQPSSKYLANDHLFAQISEFSEVFWKLRDDWKKSNDTLKSAVEKKSSQIDTFKRAVSKQRQILEVAINAALKHGHPEILQTLGQNTRLLASLQPLLLDRAKEGDHNGTLPISLLKLLARFRGVTSDALEATKLTKVLSAFSKKGNDEVKALVKSINDNLSKANLSASDDAKAQNLTPKTSVESKQAAKSIFSPKPADSGKPFASALGNSIVDSKSSDASVSQKRGRAGETGSPTVKRVNTGPVSPSTSKTAASASATLKRPLSTIGSKSSANSSTAGTVPSIKPKPTVAASKGAAGFFSSMQSATKKTQSADKTSSASAQNTSEPAIASPITASFSFGGMLEDILKPRESQERNNSEQSKSEETEAEKIKRARKEARRKLRVSWKNDLVAVRFFTHDPEEDTGHDANMVRDVTDVGNEGRMFKQMHHDSINDDDEEKEESFVKDYKVPSEIDLSAEIEPEELAKLYTRFAGKRLPDSNDQKLQDDREANTLMAIYYSPSDIPPRPRSPAEPYANPKQEVVMFGPPNETTASRSTALVNAVPQNALDPALSEVRNLLASLGGYSDSTTPQLPLASSNESNILPTSTGLRQTQQPLTSLLSATQGGFSISATPDPLLAFSQQPNVAAPGHSHLANFPGFVPPLSFPLASPAPPQASSVDVSALIASLSQMSQPAAPPAQDEYTPPAPSANETAPATPDLNALLAQIGGVAGLNVMMHNALLNPQGSQQPPEADPSYLSNFDGLDRKRGRDLDDDRDGYSGKRQNNGAGNGGAGRGIQAKKWQPPGKSKAINENHPKKFSLPCKFWPMGKCLKGADCTYRHDPL